MNALRNAVKINVGFVWFGVFFLVYTISTIVGYLMPNPFLYIQTVLFQTIQFSISILFNSVWPIDRTLSGATTRDQSGPVNNGNKGVLRILQSSSITGASPSDCLVSYPRHSLRVLPLCRDSVGVFYSPSWPGQIYVGVWS